MSARSKNAARRLACYVDAIGIRPALTGRGFKKDYQALLDQYTALPPSVQREARRNGRSIIRTVGLEAAASKLFPALAPPSRCAMDTAVGAQGIATLLAQSLGRCPFCKSWGRGKRSWPTRELAEIFLRFTKDMSLHVYYCGRHGSYHLGHQRTAVDGNSGC